MPTDAAYYQQLKGAVEDLNNSIGGLRTQLAQETAIQIDRRMVDVLQRLAALERVTLGAPGEGNVGLVSQLKGISDKLETMTKEGQQRTWLMRGAVIGLGLNLAQSTGLLPALLKLIVP